MSSGLRKFVSEEFCNVQKLFSLYGSFCHFAIVVIQKDVMMIKEEAYEDFIFSRLISYKFNDFKTVVL